MDDITKGGCIKMGFYIPRSDLSGAARTIDSAITSLMEELEAVNYYNQRADVSVDDDLKEIMIHNRDEEIEHCAMLIEWLRREMPEFDKELRGYLFTSAPLTQVEADGSEGGSAARPLSIGSLK